MPGRVDRLSGSELAVIEVIFSSLTPTLGVVGGPENSPELASFSIGAPHGISRMGFCSGCRAGNS